jgi:nucleotide-binding universal stress UspA family protein
MNAPRKSGGPLTVIVPLDGSDEAEQVLPFAKTLAEKRGATLILISVVDVPAEFGAWTSASAIGTSRELDVWVADREHYLETLKTRIDQPAAQVVVRIGTAAAEIKHVVAEYGNPLIAMTSHGRTGAKRLLLGSVANKLVHDSGCPVLVVRQGAGDPADAENLRRVLVPLDGSEFGEAALKQTASILGDNLTIHLLRVAELPRIPTMGAYDGGVPLDYGLIDEYVDAVKDEAVSYLADLQNKLQADGHTVTWEVVEGEVASAILNVARAQSVGTIAMSSHGRGGLSRIVFGSVAQQVLHEATRPLLLVRPLE